MRYSLQSSFLVIDFEIKSAGIKLISSYVNFRATIGGGQHLGFYTGIALSELCSGKLGHEVDRCIRKRKNGRNKK